MEHSNCEKCEGSGVVYTLVRDELEYCSCEHGALKEYQDKTEEMRTYAWQISGNYA